MQVYVLIHDGKRLLVFKKRVTNDFWNGKKQTSTSLVNQAGQWALPGGRIDGDRKETAAAAGMRELLEETGLTLKLEAQPFMTGSQYQVIALHASEQDLSSYPERITANLTADNEGKPKVKDWELASVELISASDVKNYLGKRVRLDPDAQRLVEKAKKGTQDIDWYEAIANVILANGLPTKPNPE